MKKLLTLLSITLLLIGCNNPNSGDDTLFNYDTDIIDKNTAEVNITWTNGAKLLFNNKPKFVVIGDTPKFMNAMYTDATTSSQLVELTFVDIKNDFKGNLSFDYTNVKTKISCNIRIELNFNFEVK